MSPTPTPHGVRFFATTTDLRDWFDANHASTDELWLGYYKVKSGRPSLTWSQAVDEALCVGWIDGVRYAEVGIFLVDLATDGVQRGEGFEAMGMRGSASGRLVLDWAPATLSSSGAGSTRNGRRD